MIQLIDKIDAVIFDMDGTLVDSMWVWTSIDCDYMKKYNLTPPERFHEDMEGMSFTETAEYFLKIFPELHHTLDELMDEWMEIACDKYLNEVQLKDGAEEFIRTMKSQGKKIGIATSNARPIVEGTLKRRGIDQLFDAICTSCEAGVGKPAPDVYLNVAKKLGVAPERCLVFEDVPMGILAGKRAGMTVCAVEDVFSRPQIEKKRELADYYIRSYNDIKEKTYEVLK